ncbi:MAG: HesA/MoeB/ThiF family protein [Muribaculaceae bacterium]|nr:HesA/MoeB/ThiF family protein [Muribaculaceae bacterium]
MNKLRYSRQIAIPEIGKLGQERLRKSRVIIIGCGALGSMVAIQLAGAGVGHLAIADFDNIDISNLQRQFFYQTEEAGLPKVEILKKRILALNPEVEVKVINKLVTSKLAAEEFPHYDFIVDATDNPDSKGMVDKMAQMHEKPCCIGGIREFAGQVITLLPGDTRFDEIFGKASGDSFLPCSLSGVIGPAAAFCASVQANEVIKFLTGSGELLTGKLFLFDLQKNNFNIISL